MIADLIKLYADANIRVAELERENAALRADKERLAEAAEEVLCSYILTIRVETGHPCPENLVICRELRAAIDATRKEAQPWGNDPIMRRHLSEGGTPA